MRKGQSEILKTIADSIPRVKQLATKAASIDCGILAGDLERVAKQLEASLKLQSRALSDDPAVRKAAAEEAALPFRVL